MDGVEALTTDTSCGKFSTRFFAGPMTPFSATYLPFRAPISSQVPLPGRPLVIAPPAPSPVRPRITRGSHVGLPRRLPVNRARFLDLDQVRWELDRAHRRLMDALAGATETGLDASRYGEAGLRSGHAREHAGWIRDWRAARGY